MFGGKGEERPVSVEKRPVSVEKRIVGGSGEREKGGREGRSSDYQATSSLHYYAGSQKGFHTNNTIIQRSTTKALTTPPTTTLNPSKKSVCHSMSHSNFYPTRNSLMN